MLQMYNQEGSITLTYEVAGLITTCVVFYALTGHFNDKIVV
jgi:hypothetical protein